MSYTNGLDKPTDYFETVTYTGTGSSLSISSLDFSPDFTWIKVRSNGTHGHNLFDIVRGVNKPLSTESTGAEGNDSSGSLTSFNSDGFTLGGFYNKVNQSGETFVSWNWLGANGTASNTDGSITSTVSANTTSGFSIVSYTGTGSAGTLGHGLGSTPKMIIVKCRSDADTWAGYHVDVGATKYMELDTTAAAQTSTQPWNDTEPTSSVFTVGNWSATNGSSRTYIAYCFAEKKGFSKAFSYTGNGSTDGSFCYLGFRPAFILLKNADRAENWFMFDNKRDTYNVADAYLNADASTAETTLATVDFLSNGFKIRTSGAYANFSGSNIIGIAFAESPLVGTNNTPATAR